MPSPLREDRRQAPRPALRTRTSRQAGRRWGRDSEDPHLAITATQGGYSTGPLGAEAPSQETSCQATSCACAAAATGSPREAGAPRCHLSFLSPQDRHRGAPALETGDRDGFPRPLRALGPPPYCPAAEGAQSSARRVGSHYWQAKGSLVSHTLPDPGSPRLAPDVRPSPLGIPYSKLSQSKHLKAKPGGGQWASDSRRRVQTPRDHKEP